MSVAQVMRQSDGQILDIGVVQSITLPVPSEGGDAHQGGLSVRFDGGRIDHTCDPMRKQGSTLGS